MWHYFVITVEVGFYIIELNTNSLTKLDFKNAYNKLEVGVNIKTIVLEYSLWNF